MRASDGYPDEADAWVEDRGASHPNEFFARADLESFPRGAVVPFSLWSDIMAANPHATLDHAIYLLLGTGVAENARHATKIVGTICRIAV